MFEAQNIQKKHLKKPNCCWSPVSYIGREIYKGFDEESDVYIKKS